MSDVFRQEYRELTEDEKALIVALKVTGGGFVVLLDKLPASREVSIAKTKIEEAVMWAVKAVTA